MPSELKLNPMISFAVEILFSNGKYLSTPSGSKNADINLKNNSQGRVNSPLLSIKESLYGGLNREEIDFNLPPFLDQSLHLKY